MQDTDAKCCCLAATGLGLRNQITLFQNQRQALRLDRGHLVIAELVEIAEEIGRQRQAGKRVRIHDEVGQQKEGECSLTGGLGCSHNCQCIALDMASYRGVYGILYHYPQVFIGLELIHPGVLIGQFVAFEIAIFA